MSKEKLTLNLKMCKECKSEPATVFLTSTNQKSDRGYCKRCHEIAVNRHGRCR